MNMIFSILFQKYPNNQRVLQELENRVYNEFQTKNDYTQRIQQYLKNIQQQQLQHQQQQQQQQSQQVIGMQTQQVHHYQQPGVQQQAPQATVIIGNHQNGPKSVVNISGMSMQQQQQQQQLKLQQQPIRASSQFVQQPIISQQQQTPNYIQQQHPPSAPNQGQNVIITNLNQPLQSHVRPQMPPQHTFVNGGSQPTTTTSDEEELYNRKIQELKANHLARLERMLQTSSRNTNEIQKLKAFIEVIMGQRRVPMEVLLKCEASLNAQRQAPPPQQQQQQQPQPSPQQPHQAQQNQINQPQSAIFQKISQPLNQPKPQDSPSNLPPQVKLVTDQTPRVTTPSQPIQPVKVVAPPVQPVNIYKQLMHSIEACNAADPVHKSSVRYLLDSIKNSIDGPEEKKIKIENEFESEKKKLVNLRECESSKNFQNEKIPEKLLLELADLPKEKFRIEAKSREKFIILPLQSDSIENAKMETSDLNDSDQENESNKSSMENYYVTLNCKIVNKNLVPVPAIRIYVPYEYPHQNPFVDCVQISNQEDDILPNYRK